MNTFYTYRSTMGWLFGLGFFSLANLFLLELIISLLIIAVLISIALTMYFPDLIPTAQLTESISLMSGAKTYITEYYSYYGSFPDSSATINNNQTTDLIVRKGTYTQNLIITKGGAITTQIAVDNPEINGLLLSFRPALPNTQLPKVIRWFCGYALPPDHFTIQGENQTNIPPHYLTFTCR